MPNWHNTGEFEAKIKQVDPDGWNLLNQRAKVLIRGIDLHVAELESRLDSLESRNGRASDLAEIESRLDSLESADDAWDHWDHWEDYKDDYWGPEIEP